MEEGKVYEAVTFHRADRYVVPVMWVGESKMYDNFAVLRTKTISEYTDVHGGARKFMLDGIVKVGTMKISKKTSLERGSRAGFPWSISKTPIDKPEEHIFISTTYND
jgi:hypothetical protein